MLYAILEYFGGLTNQTTSPVKTPPPLTLKMMYTRLGLLDDYTSKVLCLSCWEFKSFLEDQPDAELLQDLGEESNLPISSTLDDRWQRQCRHCNTELYKEPPKTGIPHPHCQAPYHLLSQQLAAFLGQPSFKAACEDYLDSESVPGTYSRIQDGLVWQNLKCPDSLPFFPMTRLQAESQAKLHLGMLLSLDWFNPNLSAMAASLSSGPLSICVANLPPELWSPGSSCIAGSGVRPPCTGEDVWVHRPDALALALHPVQGLMKNLWFLVWVQGGKDDHTKVVLHSWTEAGMLQELDAIHKALATLEMLGWFARLPKQVGEPGGGSLTSDEWRAIAILYGLAVIYTRHEVNDHKLARAVHLYWEYFEEFVEIYGLVNTTPTFHWVTHMDKQIQWLGPVHGFWTFLFEHLNKILKDFKTNGHKGGSLEITFAREFKWEMGLAQLTKDALARLIATELQKCSHDITCTGTLATFAAQSHPHMSGHPHPCIAAGTLHTDTLGREVQDELLSCCNQESNGSPGVKEPQTFTFVNWLVPLQDTPPHAELYKGFKELEVNFWQYDMYQMNDVGPDAIISASKISGVAAQLKCTSDIYWLGIKTELMTGWSLIVNKE
ncbi:hypothetical protein DACRYDRAFT_15916 [Dacryopinax primogenitus]|uniref:Uncharacterized protein n=1 Tax=Dacryopinax primogenitus (strain DJM 731) TaxID=1858805 RepID=M5G194_DACPD|nr:uncharacterized protein DACRYDRAFT_15916 [Dacryopinax primogenitus]EJU01955.1 hypothetical protein DACRYDRAFT_15916 [Dacryopinax primogenitus]